MIAVAVAKHLGSLGLVTFDETGVTGDCFIGTMPSGPNEAVALTPSGGNPTSSHHGYDEPVLQVRVRGTTDPRVPYLRARRIYEALVGLHAVTLDFGGDDEVYVVRTVAQQSDPASIGVDDVGRHEYVLNFAFYVRALTAHRV
jgi:hypothetical protein